MGIWLRSTEIAQEFPVKYTILLPAIPFHKTMINNHESVNNLKGVTWLIIGLDNQLEGVQIKKASDGFQIKD